MSVPELQVERLHGFRRVVADMDFLESIIFSPLVRRNEDDRFLNQLVNQIVQETNYPLIPPTVSALSQNYFHIYTNLRLMFVPPVESDFILHLPDLYHELAHSLVSEQHNPSVQPFQLSLVQALSYAEAYVQDEITKEKAKPRSPESLQFYLYLWSQSWTEWMIEFFCDIFAVCTLGSAFAWSHYHLAAKTGGNPFVVPTIVKMTHPPDHARMVVILKLLDLLNLSAEGQHIREAWNEYLSISDMNPTPEYKRCFPDELLATIAIRGYEGVYACGFKLADDEQAPIKALLNEAWTIFWDNPQAYPTWEKQAVGKLRQAMGKTTQLQIN